MRGGAAGIRSLRPSAPVVARIRFAPFAVPSTTTVASSFSGPVRYVLGRCFDWTHFFFFKHFFFCRSKLYQSRVSVFAFPFARAAFRVPCGRARLARAQTAAAAAATITAKSSHPRGPDRRTCARRHRRLARTRNPRTTPGGKSRGGGGIKYRRIFEFRVRRCFYVSRYLLRLPPDPLSARARGGRL